MAAQTSVGQPSSYADAVDIASPSVANVYTRRLVSGDGGAGPAGRFRVNTSVGSAVIIDAEGYLVTNYHVVAFANDIRLQLADGRLANPDLIGVDEETDLALLKVDLGPLPADSARTIGPDQDRRRRARDRQHRMACPSRSRRAS